MRPLDAFCKEPAGPDFFSAVDTIGCVLSVIMTADVSRDIRCSEPDFSGGGDALAIDALP